MGKLLANRVGFLGGSQRIFWSSNVSEPEGEVVERVGKMGIEYLGKGLGKLLTNGDRFLDGFQ